MLFFIILTCNGAVVSILARKYVRSRYQLLNVSFFRIAISEGTKRSRKTHKQMISIGIGLQQEYNNIVTNSNKQKHNTIYIL